MKLGTDVDMQTNIKEGYMIMDFKKRELIVKGILQKDVHVEFYRHYPDYILEEIYGTTNPIGVVRIIQSDVITAQDVWGKYQEHKEAVDKFCGLSHEFPTCEGSLLSLASDLDAYCGLPA